MGGRWLPGRHMEANGSWDGGTQTGYVVWAKTQPCEILLQNRAQHQKVEGTGFVWLGEEKALGGPHCNFPILEENV